MRVRRGLRIVGSVVILGLGATLLVGALSGMLWGLGVLVGIFVRAVQWGAGW